jgi:uncharacterized protein YbaR (Trm112 family)
MIREDFLRMLRCPLGHGRLENADPALLAQVNAAVSSGALRNRMGVTVERALEGGLVDERKTLFYPVQRGIPCLLVDEAIPLEQLGAGPPDS